MINQVNVSNFSKINENFNFKFYKTFDVDLIKKKISTWKEEWNFDNSRQELYRPHRETNTYFLIEHSNQWKYGDVYSPENRYKDIEIWNLIEPIIKEFENTVQGKVGKAILIKLPANKNVDPHSDKGDYLNISRRFHIPIITNDEVEFIVNDEVVKMKEGECWEINNSHIHSVKNYGNNDRVHLLFDIIPNKYIVQKGDIV